MSVSFNLTGKTALVTGASRGLGQAIAIGLAEAGADLAITSSQLSGLSATKQAIEKIGREVSTHKSDLSEEGQVSDLIQSVETAHPRVDILVNNAGIIRRSPATEHPPGDWNDVLDVNLTVPFKLAQAFGARMISNGGGKIINVASLLSFSGGINVVSYAASKGGIAQMTKGLANEWASQNVQVNAIAPGYFATDNTSQLRADTQRSAEILGRIPAGRWGTPDDLKGSVVFLASEASNYVNGHVLLVDGGWMAR